MFNLWKKKSKNGITLFLDENNKLDIDIPKDLSNQELQILVESLISLDFVGQLKEVLTDKLPKEAMQTLNNAMMTEIKAELDNFLESPIITPLEVFKKGANEKHNHMD